MRRAYLTLVGVTLTWGTVPLIVRHVELSGLAIAAARLVVAAAGLGAVVVWRARQGADAGLPRLLERHRAATVALGVILAVHWASLFLAFKRAPVSTVILIVYLAPVGVAAVAPRVLGEHHGRRTLAALAIAVAGLGLVTVPAVEDTSTSGLLLAGLAAITFVAIVVLSKPIAETYGGLRTAFVEFAGASLVLLPVLALTSWDGVSAGDGGWLLVLGLFHTGVLVALYLGALAQVPATHTGILGYLEPVSAVVLSWRFLDEPLTATTVAGGALIVVAGVLVVLAAPTPSSLEVPAHVPR